MDMWEGNKKLNNFQSVKLQKRKHGVRLSVGMVRFSESKEFFNVIGRCYVKRGDISGGLPTEKQNVCKRTIFTNWVIAINTIKKNNETIKLVHDSSGNVLHYKYWYLQTFLKIWGYFWYKKIIYLNLSEK